MSETRGEKRRGSERERKRERCRINCKNMTVFVKGEIVGPTTG